MARYVPPRTLDTDIAARVLAPAVRRTVDNVRDGAQRHAPPVKTWVTARDERVRPSHVATDAQAVPDNLRYQVPSVHGVGTDLAVAPRDPDLPIGNRANCRCQSVELPRLLADSIHAGAVQQAGARVSGEVYTRFPRAAESEFGNTSGDEAARFMGQGLQEAAARMRETVARGE